MKIFQVLNVGQGDCMIVRPPENCSYKDKTLLIDLGPGNTDITKYIGKDESIHIFLSHHDMDHLGGLAFFAGKFDQIEEITVPFFQNEITLIARAILNLKGIRESKDCGEFIHALEEVVNNQVIIKSLAEGNKRCPKLSYGYEGKRFCGHIECFNPPKFIEVLDWIGEVNIDNLCELFQEVFSSSFAQEMKTYVYTFSSPIPYFQMVESRTFNEFWISLEDDLELSVSRNKCNYVLNFILNNITLFRNFNHNSTRKNLKRIYNKYVSCTHDICMVLRMSFCNKKMLLTGDVSKKALKRLIKEGKDISASYLKVPHHGSKYNMNERILDHIAPKVAIISHNNGHFGTSRDTHPNVEVLEYLQKRNIKILLTNDIKKGEYICMKKENHCSDEYVEILP